MTILLLLTCYFGLGLPFVGWLARRLGRAHDTHHSGSIDAARGAVLVTRL
jgi:hypothetical protein